MIPIGIALDVGVSGIICLPEHMGRDTARWQPILPSAARPEAATNIRDWRCPRAFSRQPLHKHRLRTFHSPLQKAKKSRIKNLIVAREMIPDPAGARS
jgi:hypothetical protein